jgi:hypothetical protein
MSDPFHVYLNLDVLNDSSENDQKLVFSETRTIPFLTNAEDYFLTVARFNLQTSNNFPIFIPDIQIGQSDPDITAYTITVSAFIGGASQIFTQNVKYIKTDTTAPTPTTPVSKVDRSSNYYWIYNVADWLLMLNITLSDLANSLIGAGLAGLTAPFIRYDIVSGLFTLVIDKVAFLSNTFRIFFNPRLYNILPFPAVKYTTSPMDNGNTTLYGITVGNSLANSTAILIGNLRKDFLTTTTEFCPLSLMNPVRTILFTTQHLPIQAQLSQSPIIFTDDVPTGVSNNLPDITNVLTDFEISVSSVNNYNGEITYLPQGETRWIDLNPAFSLNKIDVKAFWRDKFGENHAIYLPPGCAASIKLLMRRKDFYLGHKF